MKRKRNYKKQSKKKASGINFPKFKIPEISFRVVQDNLMYTLFVGFLAILYIGNTHVVERNQKSLKKIEQENKVLKGELLTTTSELMQTSTQSAVAQRVAKLGITESTNTPKVIYFDSE